MKIAFASQNRREITGHAGQCRNFWVVDIVEGVVGQRQMVELEHDQTFHEAGAGFPDALEGIEMLVAGGMGPGLRQRLAARSIAAVVTTETDLNAAMERLGAGTLVDESTAGGPADGCHGGGHQCGCGHRH